MIPDQVLVSLSPCRSLMNQELTWSATPIILEVDYLIINKHNSPPCNYKLVKQAFYLPVWSQSWLPVDHRQTGLFLTRLGWVELCPHKLCTWTLNRLINRLISCMIHKVRKRKPTWSTGIGLQICNPVNSSWHDINSRLSKDLSVSFFSKCTYWIS
jgi:hypothetical protein